jgi:hypothetical protein
MADWQERFDRLLKGMAAGKPHKKRDKPARPKPEKPE